MLNRSWRPWPGHLCAAVLCTCVALSSCRPGDGRLGSQGTVTFDGKPLPAGTIKLFPQPGTPGPTAGGKISRGHFSIAPDAGTMAGTFLVVITATRKTGKKVFDSTAKMMDPTIADGMVDEIEQYIPARFNKESTLTVDIQKGNDNYFEFALESD